MMTLAPTRVHVVDAWVQKTSLWADRPQRRAVSACAAGRRRSSGSRHSVRRGRLHRHVCAPARFRSGNGLAVHVGEAPGARARSSDLPGWRMDGLV